ncbi:HNH endonuclease signature motif containing protein, partial [Subtercola boreus]|uniref:HNH endonuclease signature motif containing protein n=1 Tax=Subtercola boreus TaxID=120213 RepID=UPI0011C08077
YLVRLADSLRLRLAGEVAERCRPELGEEGLSKASNFTTPAGFLAANTGTSEHTAKKLMKVGGELRVTMSLCGLPNLPAFSHVAEAVGLGAIGLDVATVITTRLGRVAKSTGFTDALIEAEAQLVSLAQESLGGQCYSADVIDRFAVRMIAHLDPDGAEPTEAQLHDRRHLTLVTEKTGMTKLTGLLPPTAAGHLRAALEPFTSPRIPTFTDPTHTDTDTSDPTGTTGEGDPADGGEVEPLLRDTRTRGQKLADGLLQLVTTAAGLPTMPRLNGAAPTVNVHATLEDVISGRGIGWIDGLTEPVPASTIETLLCHSDVITTLFGEHGQVLQHGKTRRLFTAAQNRALAARDGGCVWPSCDAPPSWCESHHVEGWQTKTHQPGRTDLDNGALLCHFHHSHVHKTRWKLVMQNGTPHLIPPDWLDWRQTPRPCQQNRARPLPQTG